jgi:hypothetical protein
MDNQKLSDIVRWEGDELLSRKLPRLRRTSFDRSGVRLA